MASIKSFLVGAVKLAFALFLALVAVSIAIWAVSSYLSKREENARAPLAVPKVWPPITAEALDNVRLELTTMWRDSHIYFQFRVVGCPPVIARTQTKRSGQTFTISFLDSHGFRISEYRVSLDSMAEVVNAAGECTGLDWKGDESASIEGYQAAAKWEIGWSADLSRGEPVTEPTLPPLPEGYRAVPRPKSEVPRWKVTANWRRLTRDMTKEEVRALLGEPTKIEERAGGFSTWHYGDPYGGTISFGGDGKPFSWSEP
jgi:hypothetical protein